MTIGLSVQSLAVCHEYCSVTPVVGRSNNAIANSKPTVAGIFNILDESDNVIWAISFWATEYNSHQYTNAVVMDRNIGGHGPTANGSSTAQAQQRGFYYQWGRPFPFGYGTTIQVVNTNFHVTTSLAESAQHANSIATYADKDVTTDWWNTGSATGRQNDFWGSSSTSASNNKAVKSIFDPCPKGWMVVTPAVLNEVKNAATYKTNYGMEYGEFKDCWPNTAFYGGNNAARGSNKGCYWCNTGNADGRAIYYEFAADGSSSTFNYSWRSNAFAIRCMKDNQNR